MCVFRFPYFYYCYYYLLYWVWVLVVLFDSSRFFCVCFVLVFFFVDFRWKMPGSSHWANEMSERKTRNEEKRIFKKMALRNRMTKARYLIWAHFIHTDSFFFFQAKAMRAQMSEKSVVPIPHLNAYSIFGTFIKRSGIWVFQCYLAANRTPNVCLCVYINMRTMGALTKYYSRAPNHFIEDLAFVFGRRCCC